MPLSFSLSIIAFPSLSTFHFNLNSLEDFVLSDKNSSPIFEDLLADLEPTTNLALPLDFSISPDNSWSESICFHFSQLISLKGPFPLTLFHSYLIGKLLHEEELRLLGRLSPTLLRSRKNGRRLHTLFRNTVKHLGASSSNRYYAARRVFALYSTRDPQMIQFAKAISPARLQKLTKQDYSKLFRKAKDVGQPCETYPFHLSVFIGTTEL